MASEILIVDDEADIRDLVAGILQDEGYVTRTARNSDDALSAIVARRPNLLFLDIWLGQQADGCNCSRPSSRACRPSQSS
jgi:two-component system nitrogen regulation response regulator NtrX